MKKVVRAARQQRTATEAEVVVNVTRAVWAVQLTRSFLASLDDGMRTLERVLEKIEELLDNDSPQVTENDRLRLKYALSQLRVRRVVDAANANARNYHLSGVKRVGAHSLLRLAGSIAPKSPLQRFDWLYRFDATQE